MFLIGLTTTTPRFARARRVGRWSLVVAGWLTYACTASAQTATEEPASAIDPKEDTRREAAGRLLLTLARDQYDRGVRNQDEAALHAAFASLELAYGLWPEPELLHNMAQAARHVGQCLTARHLYGLYLKEAPDPERRAAVERHLEALSDCPGEDADAFEPPDLSTLAGREGAVAPARGIEPSGTHEGCVVAGRENVQSVESDGGESRRALASWSLGAGSALAALAAVASAAQLYVARRDFHAADTYSAQVETAGQAASAARRRVLIFAPMAGGLAAGSLLIRLLWPERQERRPQVGLGLARGGAALGVSLPL